MHERVCLFECKCVTENVLFSQSVHGVVYFLLLLLLCVVVVVVVVVIYMCVFAFVTV